MDDVCTREAVTLRPHYISWRVISFVVGLPCLLAFVSWYCVVSYEGRLWGVLETRVSKLAGELDSRETRRPVLLGDPLPGNAWDDYLAAITEFEARTGIHTQVVSSGWTTLKDFFTLSRKADASKARAILEGLDSVFSRVERGARREHSAVPISWSNLDLSMYAHGFPIGHRAQALALAVGSAARVWIESGSPGHGVNLLIALCQFGRDIGSHGDLLSETHGIAIVGAALDEFRRQMQSGRIPLDQLGNVAGALQELDSHFFKHHESLRVESIVWSNSVLRNMLRGNLKSQVFEGERWETVSPGWKHAFSRRVLEASWVLDFDQWIEDAPALDSLSIKEERAIVADVTKLAVCRNNPALHLVKSSEPLRETLAVIRLVRTAAHYLSTGEILALPDPFGTQLKNLQSANSLKIWSVGRNALDDGGKDDGNLSESPDLVFEVTRW